jgi:cation:H+ antiporter
MMLAWFGLLLGGIAIMQWGASGCADLLDQTRDRYGLPATAGGALMGLATAAPETAVNLASVTFGWTDLGLGTALGSNVPALPLAFALTLLGGRLAYKTSKEPGTAGREQAPEKPVIAPQAVPVQVLPYLGIVLLLAALTLPPWWAGLQPIDGIILVAAWLAFFLRAIWQKPWAEQRGGFRNHAVRNTLVLRLPCVAMGALASVIAAQKLGAWLGWSDLIVGLFVIGLLCALPEAYSAMRFAREGKPTVAISAATGDGIVSLTIALLPPAIVGATVGNIVVYGLNLGFLILVLGLYAILNRARRGQELGLGFVLLFLSLYAGYLALMALALKA